MKLVKEKKKKRKSINLIILSLLLIFNSTLIYAQNIQGEGITTITEEFDFQLNFIDEIQKVYEISDSILEKGYSANLNEKDAFRINIKNTNYYIIVWNVTWENKVMVIFSGERQLIFEAGDISLIDINQDGKLDVQLTLETTENKKANFHIKNIIEKKLIPSDNYFELFDVTTRLSGKEIYTIRELRAFITFENFGAGPSEINIVYSIIDANGGEVYQGIDNKIVQTEDLVIKNFNFLELPTGKYILKTEIFYGANQTGDSEQDFEIIEIPIMNLLGEPLFFISIIVILFFTVIFIKKFFNKNINVNEKNEK